MIKFWIGLAIGFVGGWIIGWAIGLGSTPEPEDETPWEDENDDE